MRQCRGCGTALSKRSQKIYCSNACQQSARRKSSTERWLESGEAWIGTRQVHYIRQYLADAQSGCCAICGGARMWLGLPLALVLDTSTGTRPTIDGRTCGWSARTATRSSRHTKAETAETGAPSAGSDTPTANRTDPLGGPLEHHRASATARGDHLRRRSWQQATPDCLPVG
jgi:hypothetical protein